MPACRRRGGRLGQGSAPWLFVGATSGMAFGEVANHLLDPGAGQPALYAAVAMGAVFASAARAPLTSLASVVEMTGDFTLTLAVMLAVAIATAMSRTVSYGTIYTIKLLRRGTDIDRPTLWRALQALKVGQPRSRRPHRRATRTPIQFSGMRTHWHRLAASAEPICTIGPSRPTDPPVPMHSAE